MKRKTFFQLSLGGGALALLAPSIACERTETVNQTETAFSVETSPFDSMSIADIHREIQEKRLNAETLSMHYLNRINKFDKSGLALNSVICTNPKALEQAREIDLAAFPVGPLHGIPVLLKDNINTRKSDGMRTTAGSLALMELWPEEDAQIVQKLRDAGAIILGKTNLSEWANFRSTNSSSGWSAVGGLTKNPHVLDRSACGSSSGSGASVAASLCQLAIGSETDGSIVCPSAINGIAGFKPTVGAVSREGIVPISSSQDTAGPMARNIQDLKICMDVIGYDTSNLDDQKSADLPTNWKNFNSRSLQGARLGVCTNFLGRNGLMDQHFEQVKKQLIDAGAELIEVAINSRAYSAAEWEILQYEFKHDLNAYLKEYGNQNTPADLESLIVFNKENKEKELVFFGQEILESSQQKGDLTDKEYLDALETAKKEAGGQIDQLIEEHQLDALIAPTNGPSWVVDIINGDSFTGGSSSAAAVAGYPNVTVPSGQVMNLPIGLSFFGKKWSDYTLLSLAASYESSFNARVVPTYLKTLNPILS